MGSVEEGGSSQALGLLYTEPAMDRAARFWRDLKRRRVFQTSVLYVVVAWAVIQAASIAFPTFNLPTWAMRALLVAAFAGFPVVVILAWVFDVSSEGIEVTRTDSVASGDQAAVRRRRWLRPLVAAPILAAIVGGTAWLWTSHLAITGQPEFTRQVRPDELPIVLVLPLENLSGRKELGWAGAGVATLIRDDLAQSRFLAVVSAARTARMAKSAGGIDALFNQALDVGITHVLTGEILRTPKGLTVTSRLTDLRRNVEVGANRQESLEPDQLIAVATSITSLVKQALGVPGTEKVDVFATDFATKNVAAYEAFVAGMQNFVNFDYAAAKGLFEVAVQKAPDFAMARYRLAHSMAALGDTAGALEQIKTARRDGVRLSAREQAYIAAGESYFARNYSEAEKQYRALLATYPYETEARALLLYVLYAEGRYKDALVEADALTSQDPGDETAWSSAAELNLKLGHYDQADQTIARLLGIAPDNPNALFLAGDSHFYREQYDLAVPQYEKVLKLDPALGAAVRRLAEIDVLRDKPVAALQRLEEMLGAERFALADRTSAVVDAANVLRAEGRPAEADAILAAHAKEFATEQVYESYAFALRAVSQLDLGRGPEALRVAQESVGKSIGRPTRYLFVRGLAEIETHDAAALARTISEIQALPARDDFDDHSERKAAHYLTGLAALERGDAAKAVPSLRAAVEVEGREYYDVYRLALARALAATGDTRAARDVAAIAAKRGDLRDFDLEFEPSRRRAAEMAAQLRN